MAAWLRVARAIATASSSTDTKRHEGHILIILGGDKERELAAARSVASLPNIRLAILSSGAATEADIREAVFSVGRPDVRVCIDRRAVDTVTNCTTLAPDVAAMVPHVSAVTITTAREHCRRANAVGALVFGAFGIRVTTQPIDTAEHLYGESVLRCIRDVVRACCWVTTGLDLSSVAKLVHADRARDSNRWCMAEGEASVRGLRSALSEAVIRPAAT